MGEERVSPEKERRKGRSLEREFNGHYLTGGGRRLRLRVRIFLEPQGDRLLQLRLQEKGPWGWRLLERRSFSKSARWNSYLLGLLLLQDQRQLLEDYGVELPAQELPHSLK